MRHVIENCSVVHTQSSDDLLQYAAMIADSRQPNPSRSDAAVGASFDTHTQSATVSAGSNTASSRLSPETLRALEWERLTEALTNYARSEPGRALCRALPLAETFELAQRRLAETDEMVRMRVGTDVFPTLPVPDIREVLARVGKGGTVEALELRDVVQLVRLGEDVLRYLARHREVCPALSAYAEGLPTLSALSGLRADLEWVVDPDGLIKDSASPELRRLTQQVHDLKQSMRRRIEAILQSSRYDDLLQDRYVAQREGRYVVPIKAEMRTAVPGIVHDVSASGATVFLEPRELVDLNNNIKVAELAVDREVRRILQDVARQLATEAETLASLQWALTELDVIHAKAELAVRLEARHVLIGDSNCVRLFKARHPLLVLSRPTVVANDVRLEAPAQFMIISGANTGGKTVTLKLVGLFALMVRAGLLLPCAEGSEMGWFPYVYADIGDAQDLAKDLSSFSSHVTRTITLFRAIEPDPVAGPPDGRWLVLLDEPMTSTDPTEGAALAQALLERLAQSGATGFVTTHYTELKVLAQNRPAFLNASVEFDVAKLAPTYRLIAGVPGGSSAIEIAGRLGMDAALLANAREHLHSDDLALETLLADLQTKQRAATEALQQAEALRRDADEAAREAAERLERQQATEAAERKAIKQKIAEEAQRARVAILAALDEVKREKTVERAKAARERIQAAESSVTAPAVAAPTFSVDRLSVGDPVDVTSLGARGILLEAPAGKSRVRVRVGAAEVSIPTQALSAIDPRAAQGDKPKASGASKGLAPRNLAAGPIAEPPLEVDVRGHTADEAVDAVIAHLDQAVLGGTPWLRVIHGHGTGKLKAALRSHLRTSPYVETFRPGDRGEGGDGVTMVEIKR
ncbi:MAG: Smr/MutS family protein [Nitrospiraceae bacterium]